MTMLVNGILPPVTTPFYPDGKIYYRKLEQNIAQFSKTPVTGIVVLGSTGEAIMLGDDEKRDVLKASIEAASAAKVMIAGAGAESAQETLRMIEYAAGLGYDLALVRTPFYYKSQMLPANMLAFFRFVADRSALPILLYNVPGFTSYDIPAEVVTALAEHPNIAGIKESSGNEAKVRTLVESTRHIHREATVTDHFEAVTGRMLREAQRSGTDFVTLGAAASGRDSTSSPKPSSTAVEVIGKLRTRKKNVGFQVVVGTAQKLYSLLKVGARGGILGFATCAPTACYEIFAAFKDGDEKLAEEKQQRIAKAAVRVVGEFGVPGVKYAMDLNGYYGGNARLPLLPLTAETKRQIEQLMTKIKS